MPFPVPENQEQPQVVYSNQGYFLKKKVVLAVLALLGIAVLLFILNFTGVIKIYQFKPQDKLLVSVGNEDIYLSAVENQVKIASLNPSFDQKTLNNILENLIEQAILDQETEQLGIDDKQLLKQFGIEASQSGKTTNRVVFTQKKYQFLKDKITSDQVESRSAFVIGFALLPIGSPDETQVNQTILKKQRQDANKALDEMIKKLKNNEEPVKVTEEIYKKYPTLQQPLSLNGYNFKHTTDQTVFLNPKVFSSKERKKGDPLEDTIFAMEPDEVNKVVQDNGSGGWVVQLKSVAKAKYPTYKKWLEAKKKELVKIHNSI